MEIGIWLMRYFAYLFHGLLGLFLLAVSGFAWASGTPSLQFGMLPWQGGTLDYVLFFGALAGLAALALAISDTLPALFFLWSAAVAVMLVKGYIFSAYKFEPGEWKTALCLIAGALLAIPGSWAQWRVRTRERKVSRLFSTHVA